MFSKRHDKTGKVYVFEACEFPTAREAYEKAQTAPRLVPLCIDGKYLVVQEGVDDRLAVRGFFFAYLFERGGQIVAVTVNDTVDE